MHLPEGERTVRFNGIPDEHVKTMQNNGEMHSLEHASNGDETARINEQAAKANEIRIQLPKDSSSDAVLDTVLAAWAILVERYQRDVFSQFTWGTKGRGDEITQCLSASNLDWQSHKTTSSLKTKVQEQRINNLSLEQGTIFLNDGTLEEWTFETSLTLQDGSLHATSTWQTSNMSRHQAVSQLHYFASILDTLFSDPDRPLVHFHSVSEDELDELWSWNTPLHPELRFCMHEKVSEKAAANPDKIAIEAWDGTLTYRQVEDFSNDLAQTLLLLDDSSNRIIPVLFEKSRWTSVAVLAVMKAGACFALLDPAQPEGRLRAVVQQVNAKLFLSSETQSTLAARVGPSADIIPVSERKFEKVYSPWVAQKPATALPPVSPDQPLYIQFTSGSTGVPKGCIITHSQYTSGAIPRAAAVGYYSHSRVLDFASYAFDVCIDSMLCTLAHGGTLCTPSEERRMNDMSGAMRDMRVTFAGMTPSVARTLEVDILDNLESLALGGEGVSTSDAMSWGQRTRIVNAYGPSETTVGATINDNLAVEVIKPGGSGEQTLVAFVVEQKKNGMRHLDGNVFGSFTNNFQAALKAMTKQLLAKLLSGEQSLDAPPFSMVGQDWDADSARTEAAQLCGVEASQVEDVYPCTPLQEGLMALSAKFQDAYVAQRVATLPTQTGRQLKKAFDVALQSCPIMRTRIINVTGRGLFQVVLRDGQLERKHGGSAAEYLKLDRQEPMDLGTALFRYGLVEDPANDKCHLVITMHHAVYDGWSMPLVYDRVNRAFEGLDTTRPTEFKHFIKHLTSLDPAQAQNYWRERLQGTSPHQFPPLPEKGYVTQANSLLEHYVTVPTSAHSKLTLATIIRGAWALVASLYMGHPDVVFGETLTGRSAPVPGIEDIEGPMITTVPIRVQLALDRPISEYLQTVHAQTVQQIPHEHLGLQNIRRLSKDARVACDLRTGLVLHPKEEEGWNIVDESHPANNLLPADDADAAREALKFNTYALMLVCTLDENGFLIMASFDNNCISKSAMEKVLVVLNRIVLAFLGNPESKLGDVAILDPEEERDAEALRPRDVMSDSAIAMPRTPSPERQDAAPSPNQEKLKILLSRILGIPAAEINSSDSFFELGGDSISAMRLVSDARAQLMKFTVAQVFQSTSLAELAALVGNEKEDKLVEILSRIIGMPKDEIKASDSFFDLGGDSIGAMRLVSDARAQGINITVAQVFESSSLAELAASAQDTAVVSQSTAISNKPYAALGKEASFYTPDRIGDYLENFEWQIVDVYPARPLQQLAVEGTVDLPRYSLRYELVNFTTPIDRSKLEQACQELVARNEVLRTVFIKEDDNIFGVVLASLQVPYAEIAIPEGEDVPNFIQASINADIEAPKPHGSSFVSFTLFTSPSGTSTLSFRISHAQYDEMCLPTLFAQLSALYSDTPVPQTLPFTTHVNHVMLDNIPKAMPYWANLLSGSQMTVLKPTIPLTHRRPTDVYMEFDISSRPSNITIGSLPTAAWALVLARRLNLRDVVFGEVVSGRNLGVPNADRIFGPTWQYIPFRVPFSSTWTYLDLLNYVQTQHVASAAYESMGFDEIVANCTDWNKDETKWFDTVVHQAPAWVEELPFGEVEAKFQTVYPHAEPLREWKCQAFVKQGGKRLGIEIVTFEEWRGVAEGVLKEVGEALAQLQGKDVGKRIFAEVAE
ncbi:hypothetical protein PTNB73_04406 [Pyrenophora teres f. teres]|nr:hypothetical protein PTNB73_04406 [Pyrenophora teres f. teres]